MSHQFGVHRTPSGVSVPMGATGSAETKTLLDQDYDIVKTVAFLIDFITQNNKQEEEYKNQLGQAYAEKDYQAQCVILGKLAEHHLKWYQYDAAAKLLNGALAICRRHLDTPNREKHENQLLNHIQNVEKVLLEKEVGVKYLADAPVMHNKKLRHQELSELREKVKKELKEIEGLNELKKMAEMRELFKKIDRGMKLLLSHIIEDCIALMQSPPPCGFAFIGTGSLAREEMTPYSDIEYFILIAENKPEYKKYFKRLAVLFELQIINFGETDICKGRNLLPASMLNPTSKGFSLDVHKKSNNDEFDLVATSEALAHYQTPEGFVLKPGNHLSSSLMNVTFVTGTAPQLLESYQQAVKKILDQSTKDSSKPLRLTRALSIFKEDIDRFQPSFDQLEEGVLFRVKDDLYRLPHIVVDTLALVVDLKTHNTWDRIGELYTCGIFTKAAEQSLKMALNTAIFLRLQVYSHYGFQHEAMDTLYDQKIAKETVISSNSTLYGVSEKSLAVLTNIYKTLIPLHYAATLFYKKGGDLQPFKVAKLDDTTYYTAGLIARRLCQYEQASQCFDKALKSEEGRDLGAAASCYLNLGTISSAMRDINNTIKYHTLAYEHAIRLYGENSVELAVYLNNLGLSHSRSADPTLALHHLGQALNLEKQRGEPTDLFAVICNNMSVAFSSLGQYEKSLEYLMYALKTASLIFDRQHPRMGILENNAATELCHVRLYDLAKGYAERALAIGVKCYGPGHPKIAVRLNNLAAVLERLGQRDQAIQNYKEALAINLHIHGPDSGEAVTCYNNLAAVYLSSGRAKPAIQYFNKAYKSCAKSGDLQALITVLNGISAVYISLKKNDRAVRTLQRALFFAVTFSKGKAHPFMITTLCNLGVAEYKNGNKEKAEFHLRESIKFALELYRKDQFEVLTLHSILENILTGKGEVSMGVSPELSLAGGANAVVDADEVSASDLDSLETLEDGHLKLTISFQEGQPFSALTFSPGAKSSNASERKDAAEQEAMSRQSHLALQSDDLSDDEALAIALQNSELPQGGSPNAVLQSTGVATKASVGLGKKIS